MWLKDKILKLLGLEQHQGYSLIDALREEEEELGFGHDDPPIVVQKLATKKQVPERAPSRFPLNPASSGSSGLPADPPSPPQRSEAHGSPLIRRNSWPIRLQRVSNTLENTTEHIYSTPWLRYMAQVSRDAAANLVLILTAIPFILWLFISVYAWLCSKFTSCYVWLCSNTISWLPPVGIVIALADLVYRA
jgi:hypothetical protein